VQGSPALCTSWVAGQCYNPSCRSVSTQQPKLFLKILFLEELLGQLISVGDPDPKPDPQDPHDFGPPGSGSISQRYGSGSGAGSSLFLINVLSGLK
jgi:hypothetical protein